VADLFERNVGRQGASPSVDAYAWRPPFEELRRRPYSVAHTPGIGGRCQRT
jgi:hypothetical protein